jgi:hypothetical protein
MPLYSRILRLRHLELRPVTTFVLFEGSVILAGLLALAEVVEPWAMLIVPVAVAIMVKLNDVVAGVLLRPLALAQLRAPRVIEGTAVGWSRVSRTTYLTALIDTDDAVADPDARPAIARGIAAVPDLESAPGVRRRPGPGLRPPLPDQHPGGADGRGRGNQGRFAS